MSPVSYTHLAAENISDEELQEALKALEEALENGADPSEASEALKNALLSQAQVNSALRSLSLIHI